MKQKVCGFLYSLVLSKKKYLFRLEKASLCYIFIAYQNKQPFLSLYLLCTPLLMQKTTLKMHSSAYTHFSPRVRRNRDRTTHIAKCDTESTWISAGSTLQA